MEEEGKIQVRLSLDSDAAALLVKLAGSPRKQGEYVSKLIRLAGTELGDRIMLTEKIADLERRLSEISVEVAELKEAY